MKSLYRASTSLLLAFALVGLAVGPVQAQKAASDKASAEATRTRASAAVRQAARRLRKARPAAVQPPNEDGTAAPAPEAPAPEAPALEAPIEAPVAPAAPVAPVLPPIGAPPPPPPPSPSGSASESSTDGVPAGGVELPGEKQFNSCRKLPGNRRIVKLNLKPDTELNELVNWISTITCTQFLIPGSTSLAGKKITIISPRLISPAEAYRLFLAALESVGLTVEPTDRFLRIVETNRARFTNLPFLGESDRVPGDKRYVTRLIRLQNLDAKEVTTNVLQRLKGEQGDIIPYGPDTLIITDQAVMIQKMIDLLEALDKPIGVGEKMWMVRIKNSSAVEMAARLAEIFDVDYVGRGFDRRQLRGGTAPAATPKPPPKVKTEGGPVGLQQQMSIAKLIPVERTNYLIVVAQPLAYQWLKVMLSKLDVPLENGQDQVHIYYCEHANCDELAVTLGSVTGVAVSVTSAPGRGRAGANAAPMAAPRPAGGPNEADQQSLLFEGDVRVNFDRPTNSLVILSSIKDYQAIRSIIEQLDQPRKQVFIEAVIMEVLLDKTRELGVAYHGGKDVSLLGSDQKSLLLGGFRAAQTLNPAGLLGGSALDGLAGAMFGPVIPQNVTGELFGTSFQIPAFGMFLQALQRNNDVNVLSSPYIIITNNEEGEISVGQNIPFPGAFMGGGFGGGAAGAIGGLLPSVSVQRQDVALKLKLIPSVNEHDMIRMEVDQEISDIASVNFNGLGPSTTKRTAKTTVVTRDQQTVLIGGLMSDRTSESVQKIPILGDIPILGFFFRNRTTQRVKTNIIIALTPYVITEPNDLRFVVEKKMRERREFIERFTAFQDTNPLDSAEFDYSKSSGMLESINKTIRGIEDEERAIMEVRARDLQSEESPIELPPQALRTRRRGPDNGEPGAGPALEGTDQPAPVAPPPPADQPQEAPAPPPENGAIDRPGQGARGPDWSPRQKFARAALFPDEPDAEGDGVELQARKQDN